jgi:hypothetical protein
MTGRSRRTRTVAAPLLAVALVALAAGGARAEEPKVACIAAADRGQELRDEGKYGAAREAFVTCARDVCPALVAKSCMRWLGELDAALPTVVVAARDAEGRDVAAATVLVDGAVVAEGIDGLPLAIDPGEHVVRVERAGGPPAEVHVVVRAGEKGRSIAVTLASFAPAPVPPPAAAGTGSAAILSSAPFTESRQGAVAGPSVFTTRNVTGLSVLGAAVVSTAAAAYFDAAARNEASTAAGYRAEYPSNACARTTSSTCTAWSDAVDAQNRDAVSSYVLFAVGGALAIGGAATWLLWPHGSGSRGPGVVAIAASLTPGRAGLRISGSF